MNGKEYLQEIGRKVREIRRSKGISMRKLATMIPLHKSTISEIERGKINHKILTLRLLADTFGVDVKDFL